MQLCFALRQIGFLFRCLTLASALWFISHPPSSVGAEASKDSNQVAQRDYDLKVKEHNLALRDYHLKVYGFWLTFVGLVGTAVALVIAYLQYGKADQWKQAEFLAKDMDAFLADPDVGNVLMMIDWASRRINLFHTDDTDIGSHATVTRKLQVSALRPHTLVVTDGGSDAQADQESESVASEGRKSGFSREEARIRDSYDRFLDYLGRFGSHVRSGLVSRRALDPHLAYWIKDIAAYTDNADDAAWTCALMAYIEFYGFNNVHQLFGEFGYDISTSGTLFEKQSAVMKDQELAKKLRDACHVTKR